MHKFSGYVVTVNSSQQDNLHLCSGIFLDIFSVKELFDRVPTSLLICLLNTLPKGKQRKLSHPEKAGWSNSWK